MRQKLCLLSQREAGRACQSSSMSFLMFTSCPSSPTCCSFESLDQFFQSISISDVPLKYCYFNEIPARLAALKLNEQLHLFCALCI